MAMQSPSSSSSSSISYAFTYQVFLSFRGIDTRHGFTGNLYKALTNKGIHTFIDDHELQGGDEITPSLLKAIEESRIFIPVFSINYASSSFCLDELVHIMHCYKTKGRAVLPVFYGVDPSQVRHRIGSYGEALAKHEKRFQNDKKNMERFQQWKAALSQAANLSGYHNSTPGYEYKLIGKIVKCISNKIHRQPLHVANYPVGMQSRVKKVKSLLDDGPDDGVHMVGIYGIGGLGKSTLARAIYNFVADQFDGLCFLHDVREHSAQNDLKHLQEELLLKTTGLKIKLDHVFEGIPIIKERLCRKKILLILDDVDDMKQLHALAGGLDWFGRGSRVIITTRDKHLLTCHGIESMHEVQGLYGTKALELLRWMAFKNNKVPSSYDDVLNRAISYASGLPLVLEIVGSNLFGKRIEEWKGTLDGYEKIPNKKIHEILKVSYDALEEEQQSVFLDIACCFKGCGWGEFEDILRAHYGHCITHHLGMLAEKSLVKISTHDHSGSIYDVRLHDLIKDMGKEVVRQESPKEPGERSRLWRQEDIVHVLKENTGTSKIEMIYMNFHSGESVIDQKGKAFKKMKKLKTLIIEDGNFSEGLKYLPSSLITLKWKGCISESLSSTILSKKFQTMKILTLDFCEYLTHIPDVSSLQNLEKLSFACCKNLITIHNSVGYLNKLEFLDAVGCIKLECFPPLLLPFLKKLGLSNCESLNSFPEILCKMTNIKDISVINSSIGELPSSFQNLSELDELSLRECGMVRFPKQNDKMYSIMFSIVTKLTLCDCNLSDECLPIVLKLFVNVTSLNLSENNFKIISECLSECHLLRILNLDSCKSLVEIRGIPPNLEELSALECESLSSSSRRMLMSQKFQNMKVLTLDHCEYLTQIPDVSCLQNLEKLSFACCENLITIHNSVGYLNKLEFVSAAGCIKLECFPPLCLPSLKELQLFDCESLNSFPELLCKMTNIKDMALTHTSIGELPSSFQNLSELDEFYLLGCGMLRFPKQNDQMYSIVFSNVIELCLQNCNLSDECLSIFLKWCVNLEELDLSRNYNFKIIPECLSECHHLKHLDLYECTSLEEIRGIPPNLETLSAFECDSLSSSSRRMLMSQELHKSQCTHFLLPHGREGIPDWFEHQSREHRLSFWFRKEIPSMTFMCIPPADYNWTVNPRFNYFENGYEIIVTFFRPSRRVYFEHTNLIHITKFNALDKWIHVDNGLLKNKWINVYFNLWDFEYDDSAFAKIGIHVWKEKSNTEEENVVFTDPCIRKTKSDEDINASLSSDEDINASLLQKKRKRKKFSKRINLLRKIWARFRKQNKHRS